MDDYLSSDDDFHYSDQGSVDGFENDEPDVQLVTPKGPTTLVFDYVFLFFSGVGGGGI